MAAISFFFLRFFSLFTICLLSLISLTLLSFQNSSLTFGQATILSTLSSPSSLTTASPASEINIVSSNSASWLTKVSGGATRTRVGTLKKGGKNASKRRIRMKKKSFTKRFFGQYLEIIRAFFDSLIDPEYENTLEELVVPLPDIKKKRTKRFGGLDDLPPEPKG
jgi:hypothetical protein